MDNTLYDYDCMIQNKKNERFYKGISVWTKLKDKVSLATAWLGKKMNNVDLSKASMGYSDCYIDNTDAQEINRELRRKELNS